MAHQVEIHGREAGGSGRLGATSFESQFNTAVTFIRAIGLPVLRRPESECTSQEAGRNKSRTVHIFAFYSPYTDAHGGTIFNDPYAPGWQNLRSLPKSDSG
ncbi:MAG: hypothetical protein WCA10_23110 [Terracidiphilus sp.]